MIVEAMNYSNPVTDSIRHDWAVNAAEHGGTPYSLFGGNVIGGRVTRNAKKLFEVVLSWPAGCGIWLKEKTPRVIEAESLEMAERAADFEWGADARVYVRAVR